MITHHAFANIPKPKRFEKVLPKSTIPPSPGIIRRDLYSVPEIRLPDPFNSLEAMFKLFPGKKCQFEFFDELVFSYWSAPKTKKKKLPDWANPWDPNDWVHTFPWPESETEHLATLKYKNSQGEDCIVLCTQSTEFSYGTPHCGRTQGAVLGMALFIKENNNWILKKFNPAIGCYGSFSQAVTPKLVKGPHGEEIFYFESANGGPGGPYTGNCFVIVPTDSSFAEACVIKNSCRWYHLCEWSTQVELVEDSTQTITTMLATINGIINGDDEYMNIDEDWDMLSPDVLKYARHHYKFKFKEVKEYIFENNKYALQSTTTYVWNKGWKEVN